MVKIKIQFTDRVNIQMIDRIFFLKQCAKEIKLFPVAMQGCKAGRFNFKKLAHFQKADQKSRLQVAPVVVYQGSQKSQRAFPAVIVYKGANPGNHGDQAFSRQIHQTFVDNGSTDAQLQSKFTLF